MHESFLFTFIISFLILINFTLHLIFILVPYKTTSGKKTIKITSLAQDKNTFTII